MKTTKTVIEFHGIELLVTTVGTGLLTTVVGCEPIDESESFDLLVLFSELDSPIDQITNIIAK